MKKFILISLASIAGLGVVGWLALGRMAPSEPSLELLNVSYDPTRELWRDLNQHFIARYESESGTHLTIKQSHGGSSSQARSVIDGLDADVVTLALWSDTDALRRKGLIAENWENRLPSRSLPYYSTIVFVVRKGNPKQIKDWPDLVRSDVEVITPNPKTSGNGKLSVLAAWAAVVHKDVPEADGLSFLSRLYQRVPVLDTGARGSSITFAQKKLGDVHLTWENEAYLEVQEAGGELELIYPSVSIRAEPHVAVVDANVARKGTEGAALAYLQFLYTDEGQEIIARHFYRPTNEVILRKHESQFPPIKLVPVTDLARNWDEVQEKFFAAGSIFDRIYSDKHQ